MDSKDLRAAARLIALLLLTHMVLAPIVNFRLLAPAMSAPPGFVVNAAPRAGDVQLAILVAAIGSALVLGIAITAYPLLARHARTAATWFVALATVGIMVTLAEGLLLRAMLTLSQQAASAGSTTSDATTTFAAVLRATRNAAHFTNFVVSGAALLSFYAALWRARLVPRWLATACLLALVPLFVAALLPLFGRHTVMLLFLPIGVAELAFVAWLAARGFVQQAVPAGVVS